MTNCWRWTLAWLWNRAAVSLAGAHTVGFIYFSTAEKKVTFRKMFWHLLAGLHYLKKKNFTLPSVEENGKINSLSTAVFIIYYSYRSFFFSLSQTTLLKCHCSATICSVIRNGKFKCFCVGAFQSDKIKSPFESNKLDFYSLVTFL